MPSRSPSPTHFRRRPQQGGDGGARAASAEPPLNHRGLRPLSPRSADPARLARGRPRARPAVTHSPPARPPPAHFRCNAAILTPAAATNRGDLGKGPTAPWRPSVPAGVADSAPSRLSCLVQATASPTPELCGSPGSSTAERKAPVSALHPEPARGRRSSKVTRARIKKSNHFASCRSHPPQSAAAGPPARDAFPALLPAPVRRRRLTSLISPPSFQELSLLTVPLARLHEVPRARSSKSSPPTWPVLRLGHQPRSAHSTAARPLVRGVAKKQTPQDAYVNFPLPQVHARTTKR